MCPLRAVLSASGFPSAAASATASAFTVVWIEERSRIERKPRSFFIFHILFTFSFSSRPQPVSQVLGRTNQQFFASEPELWRGIGSSAVRMPGRTAVLLPGQASGRLRGVSRQGRPLKRGLTEPGINVGKTFLPPPGALYVMVHGLQPLFEIYLSNYTQCNTRTEYTWVCKTPLLNWTSKKTTLQVHPRPSLFYPL